MPTVIPDSRSALITDPLRNFRFVCRFTRPNKAGNSNEPVDLAHMGFMSASGLNVENSVISYREGGMNTTPQRMPGQSEFSPITLSRGVIIGQSHTYQWIREIFSVIAGGGTMGPEVGQDFRSNLDISVLAHPATSAKGAAVKLRFRVFRCWPVSMGFSDLDAGGNSVLMEQMVLQHEGWQVSYAKDPYMSDAAAIKAV